MAQTAPPPYSAFNMTQEAPYEPYDNEKLKPLDVDVDVKSVASSDYLPENGRTLHVYHDNWKGRDGKIYDDDKETVLYSIAQRNRSPQLTVRGPNSDEIATLSFHTWSRKMDATFRGNMFRLGSSKACWKGVDVHYDSPAFQAPMTWKRKTIWTVLAINLVDEYGVAVAKFSPVVAKRKFGRIQLFRGDLTQSQIDEIVFTGLSVMQDTYFYVGQYAGSTAAVSSSAAAAAAT
jgi:hypothetical protein